MTPHQAYTAVRDAAALRAELAHMLAAFGIVVLLLCAWLALERALMRRAGADDGGWFISVTLGVLALSGAALVWISLA